MRTKGEDFAGVKSSSSDAEAKVDLSDRGSLNDLIYYIIAHYDYSMLKILFGSKLWLLPNCGNVSKFSYVKNFNIEKYILRT